MTKQVALDTKQAAEVLSRGFRLPLRVFVDTDASRRSYVNKRFVLWSVETSWTWAFLVTQDSTATGPTYHSFFYDDQGVMHAQAVGSNDGDATFDFMADAMQPHLEPIDVGSPVWPLFLQLRDEIFGDRKAGTIYATTTAGLLNRTTNPDGVSVGVFFSSENTRSDGNQYKILLMRVTDAAGRDDLVATVFNVRLAQDFRPLYAPSLVSPLFRSAVRLYTAKAYPQMLDVLTGPDAAEWVHLHSVTPYPDCCMCLCWTRPKLQRKSRDSAAVYDDMFTPFQMYRITGSGLTEHGKKYYDLVANNGDVVRRPSHNFIRIPGKHEDVRID